MVEQLSTLEINVQNEIRISWLSIKISKWKHYLQKLHFIKENTPEIPQGMAKNGVSRSKQKKNQKNNNS